jgi:hypothetical protein
MLDKDHIIIVVVDRLTKYTYIILITEIITTSRLANLLLRHVFANHGILNKITSDRDKLFISNI